MDLVKEKITDLLLETNRPGIQRLIHYMEQNGFFTAPCSSQYHLSREGGLAEHSLNVCQLSSQFYVAQYNETIPVESIIIASLLHDLGKADYRGKPNYIPNILKSGKISDSKPYETNKECIMPDHAYKSCMIASQFIELTEDEEFAIMYHNGMYTSSGRDISGKERPLQQLLHFSDMWASRFLESEGK